MGRMASAQVEGLVPHTQDVARSFDPCGQLGAARPVGDLAKFLSLQSPTDYHCPGPAAARSEDRVNAQTHSELANFIWDICNLLRGPYKRNEYRKVILPLTVLRRFDCVLADTKDDVLAAYRVHARQSENVRHQLLAAAAQRPFYNTSPFDFARLLDDPDQIAPNLNAYIAAYSPNVRDIMASFDFGAQIARLDDRQRLFQVIQRFANLDLSPQRVDNMQMGYVFEELIRIAPSSPTRKPGSTSRPARSSGSWSAYCCRPSLTWARLTSSRPSMTPRAAQAACSVSRRTSCAATTLMRDRICSDRTSTTSHGQCAARTCSSRARTPTTSGWATRSRGTATSTSQTTPGGRSTTCWPTRRSGSEWKQQQQTIKNERDILGYQGRFGAGLPRINDGSLLFLQHMLSKMAPIAADGTGGSRIAIVFNGSPLFTGDAGGGESNIRQWIIENDWLETIIALPDQLFYNTGISTYIWILTNRKEEHRSGKVQLIDAREFYVKMRRSLGNKRNELSADQIADLTRIHGSFTDGETTRSHRRRPHHP